MKVFIFAKVMAYFSFKVHAKFRKWRAQKILFLGFNYSSSLRQHQGQKLVQQNPGNNRIWDRINLSDTECVLKEI